MDGVEQIEGFVNPIGGHSDLPTLTQTMCQVCLEMTMSGKTWHVAHFKGVSEGPTARYEARET